MLCASNSLPPLPVKPEKEPTEVHCDWGKQGHWGWQLTSAYALLQGMLYPGASVSALAMEITECHGRKIPDMHDNLMRFISWWFCLSLLYVVVKTRLIESTVWIRNASFTAIFKPHGIPIQISPTKQVREFGHGSASAVNHCQLIWCRCEVDRPFILSLHTNEKTTTCNIKKACKQNVLIFKCYNMHVCTIAILLSRKCGNAIHVNKMLHQ